MTKSRMKSTHFTEDIDAIEEVSEKYWIKNVIFYKWDPIEYFDLVTKLEKFGIYLKNYSNKEDLKNQAVEFSKEYEIIYVNTAMELLVNTVNEVREALWRPMSDNPDIFRNKFLQRELIQNYNPELGVKFMKWTPEDLKIEEVEENVWYPFIIKPVDWVQSAWVEKICNREEFSVYLSNYNEFHDRLKSRWVDNKELIVEEFVDWILYSIDYFVSDFGDITISKPVKVRLWVDLWVKDYCNFARIVSQKTEWEFKWKRLKSFVNSTVKACWIRNTFVHHEFKINSKGELKTIELNWRIWGWRLEIIRKAYWVNMYDFICNKDTKAWALKESIVTIKVYSVKKWILKWFNKKLFDKIDLRESVYDISTSEWYIWKEVWLTHDWFTNVASIKLKSKDYKVLRKDYLYIKSKFKDLLVLEKNKKEESKKTVLNKLGAFFSL